MIFDMPEHTRADNIVREGVRMMYDIVVDFCR